MMNSVFWWIGLIVAVGIGLYALLLIANLLRAAIFGLIVTVILRKRGWPNNKELGFFGMWIFCTTQPAWALTLLRESANPVE